MKMKKLNRFDNLSRSIWDESQSLESSGINQEKRRGISSFLCLLAVVLLCSIIMIGGASAVSVWDGKSIDTSFSGTGYESSPYQISTAAELAGLAKLVNDGESQSGIYFELTDDIDLQNKLWTPIGYVVSPGAWIGGKSLPFKGNFNGNNHVVSNLYINLPDTDGVGLFGNIASAEILNLHIMNADVNGKSGVGALVGYVNSGNDVDIIGCTANGNIEGNENVGGLVGWNNAIMYHLSVQECQTSGIVTGKESIGGLIGDGSGTTYKNCYSDSTVTGNENIGGLIGELRPVVGFAMNRCYSTGVVTGGDNVGGLIGKSGNGPQISECYSTATVSGGKSVGGILGYHYGVSSMLLSDSYSTSRVSGTECIGGIVGESRGVASISRCYAVGDISGVTHVGGIIGLSACPELNNRASSSINDCVALNQHVTGIEGVGRLVGSCSNTNLIFCYATTEMKNGDTLFPAENGGTSANSVDNVKTLHPAQSFYDDENMLNWDFENTWKMSGKYPILMWQPDESVIDGFGSASSPGFSIVSLLLAGLVCVLICRTRK